MQVRGILLDLEGVLYQEGTALPGAPETVSGLQSQNLALRFLTNTTTQPQRILVQRLQRLGFWARERDLFTPSIAAGKLLRRDGLTRVHLAAPDALAEDFQGFDLVQDAAQAIVLGDLYRGFSWDRLNGLFEMLMGGARLIALHRNRYCRREGKLALDLGPFVAALEQAAGAKAEVVGKPAPAFFHLAVQDMGLSPAEVIMVGDDLEADIGGAQAAGLRAYQVETGKFTEGDLENLKINPDGRLASVANLPRLIDSLRC